jgi:predicted DNA-binding ribbon-helix-helix protein
MARPRTYDEERVATAVRLPHSLHAELRRLARARDVSVNYLITRAVEELVTRAPGLDDESGLFTRPTSMGRSA